MGTGIFFPLCAIPFSLIMIILFYKKGHIDSKETWIFNTLIVSNFLGLIIEILCTYASKIYMHNHLLSLFIYKAYLFYLIFWISTMAYYVFSMVRDDNNIIRKRIPIFVFYYLVVAFILTILPIESIIRDNFSTRYTTGLSVDFTYIVSSIAIIFMILMMAINYKNLNNKRYVPVLLFLLIGGSAAIVQMYYPQILLMTYIETLICVIMYFTIENPDIKMIEKLEAANIVAEKANRAKSDFLSSMSHEIRTPLNAIVGFSECIKNCDSLDEAKENANDVISASNTLLEIVNGILDISKIEAGKLEIINSDYDSRKLFEDASRLIKSRIGDKPIDFKVNIAEDLPDVLYGDHTNVKKIAINLLTNAVKYTDKGFVKFDVSCVKTKDDICRILISVEDTGRGIKKENIDKLFTKFQRLDEDRNTTIEGTGLGLAITKQLVEMMNGNIVVNSIYGRGSKFIAAIDQRISYKEIIKEEEVIDDSLDLTGKKILVVDDNKLNLKVAKKLLEKYNPIIDFAESGMECLDKIKIGNEYDLVLMDDMMPKMRGTETFIRLKKISGYNIPTVILTANAISGMREQYLKDGFVAYLSKPIDRMELYQVLSNNINNKKSEILKEDNKKEVRNSDEKEEISYNDYHDKRVLIVDDNNLNIKVASIVLKPYNIIIESVNSGYECIDLIKNGNIYNLIFMDDMMPNLSGVETLHELKKIEGFNQIVVVLTANAIEDAKENYIKEGFDDYLSKPIDKKEMDRVLNKFLNKEVLNEKNNNDEIIEDIEEIITTDELDDKVIETKTNNFKVNFEPLPDEIFDMGNLEFREYQDKEIEEQNKQVNTSEDINILKQNDIDVLKGIELLGDLETYDETLKEFKKNLNDRLEKLVKYKEAKDMDNYAIEIHALKSDSKYLGFTKLADISYKQEIESKNNNANFIDENYKILTDEIIRVLRVVNRYLSKK